ncbi:MAG: MBL fold metallo-hydrolase [Leptolyngbya sp. Prado105]|nr:MBL fold metallo-hydrolase [Leptolyngbya sp. Prado105]
MPLESSTPLTSQSRPAKAPRLVLTEENCSQDGYVPIFAFPPNRDTLGGTSYLIVEKDGNLLIDCPAWDDSSRSFLDAQGGVTRLMITHRGGMGKVREIQTAFDSEVIIQEQEAYLLPNLKVTSFQENLIISPQVQVIWTAGHSPGTACVYLDRCSGVLFSGRHLVADSQGNPVPLRTAKTFHWIRQIRNTQKLLDRFNSETLNWICPGGNIGLLRGKSAIDHAYEKLAQLNLEECINQQPLL